MCKIQKKVQNRKRQLLSLSLFWHQLTLVQFMEQREQTTGWALILWLDNSHLTQGGKGSFVKGQVWKCGVSSITDSHHSLQLYNSICLFRSLWEEWKHREATEAYLSIACVHVDEQLYLLDLNYLCKHTNSSFKINSNSKDTWRFKSFNP